MISYDKLWQTMNSKGITQYRLIKDYNFSRGQLFRLRHDHNVNIYTLHALCNILDCRVEEIVEITKD